MANNESISRMLLRRPQLLRVLRPAKRLLIHLQAVRDLTLRSTPGLSQFKSQVGRPGSWEDYLDGVQSRDRPSFFFARSDLDDIDRSVSQMPASWRAALADAAERACEGRVNVFGFRTKPMDGRIDWHRDPSSDGMWERRKYHKLIRLESRPDRSDYRVVWELNRLYFLVTLGQAYRLVRKAKYVETFMRVVQDWIERNPCLRGINWTSSMEAAVRSVNLIWAFHLFRDADELTPSFLETLLHCLYLHGEYIADHIEHVAQWTTNHTVANYTGLLYLGILFPEWKPAGIWKEKGFAGLQREIMHQVNSEGVHYESSTYYHGFVAEMCLSAMMLAHRNNLEFPETVTRRIESMVHFTERILRPDGCIPLVGDSDDGRLVRLEAFLDRPPADQRWLLSLGADAFEKERFVHSIGDASDSLWYCSRRREEGDRFTNQSPSSTSKSTCLEDAGFAVLRGAGFYLFVCAEKHGTQGLGNHQHNDWLSCELIYKEIPLIVDPGTYMYNRDPGERNRFRETAAHNTLRIDGQDIVEIPSQTFALFGDPRARITRYRFSDEGDFVEAEHRGYERLTPPVIHRRRFLIVPKESCCIIDDVIEGTGTHDLEWVFQFHSGIRVSVDGLTITAGTRTAAECMRIVPANLDDAKIRSEASWVSPAYGRREPGTRVRYCVEQARLPLNVFFAFVPGESEFRPCGNDLRSLLTLCAEGEEPSG